MAGVTATGTSTISDQFRTHFEKALLEQILPELRYAQFAMRNPLPGNIGATKMRMFRFAKPSIANVQSLSELTGGTITYSAHKQLALEYIEVQLAQYGQSISITDQLDATALFDMVGQANIQNGAEAALHCDYLTQNELMTSSGTADNVNYATKNFIYAGSATDYAGVYNGGTYSADLVIRSTEILDAATSLKIQKAPRISGDFVMVVPPQVARDIMEGVGTKTAWTDVNKYNNATKIFNGEIGKLYGVRVVETSEAYRTAATAPGAAPTTNINTSGNVFSSVIFGRHAYGISDLSTLGSPLSPKVLLVQGADKADPLNQIQAIVSWKTFWAAKVIQPLWLTHVFTQTGYGQ